jgi:hypothetical protein
MISTDIDIDLADRDSALSLIRHIPALQNDLAKHKTSVYFQNIPTDPTTGFASIDSKTAADLGYFKIDLLNNTIYRNVKDEQHLNQLINKEPDWSLFEDVNVVKKLTHIHDYFYVVNSIKPKNIDDLAIIIALIRPGKKYLLGKPRNIIDKEIWDIKDKDTYSFKKSHSYAYAVSIVVQLNSMIESCTQ